MNPTSGETRLPDHDGPRPQVRHIVFAVAPELVLLDACGPLEAFHRAELTLRDARRVAPDSREPVAYRTTVASIDGGALDTFPGLPVLTQCLDTLDDQPIDTLIVPGVPVDGGRTLQPALIDWIARRTPQVRRVCSVCTGAFYLAEAGVLDGRRATTHWRDAGHLAERFPRVTVDAEPIFIREPLPGADANGDERAIWTSAGVTAGIDLALALIQEDFGHPVAMQLRGGWSCSSSGRAGSRNSARRWLRRRRRAAPSTDCTAGWRRT
ncbi:AraC family transcriptional regulator [Paraburkholderia bengalensis]|uniref:AraC family transcriptional regulator n=1 Tax=Paraburkholderia bengalensis TaxID=2747562 RepID=UPI003AF7BD53